MLNYLDKKGEFQFGIPYNLRAPLLFTVFFAFIGILIKSIIAGEFIFTDFFIKDYITWFKSFGSFVEIIKITGEEEFLISLLRNWYYFFYTGGLISLIWSFLDWAVRIEFNFKRPQKSYPQIQEEPHIIKKIPTIEDLIKKQAESQKNGR